VLWSWSETCLAAQLLPAGDELPPAEVGDHRSILKLTKDYDDGACGRVYFEHPSGTSFRSFKSWSADVRVPSGSTSPRTGAALDFHSGGVDGGLSWYAIIGIGGYELDPGSLDISAHCNNRNRPYQWLRSLQRAELDEWYNLRMDIVIVSDDELRIDFFVDGRLMAHESPYEAPIILGEGKTGGRMLEGAWAPEEERTGVFSFYLDNVFTVYSF